MPCPKCEVHGLRPRLGDDHVSLASGVSVEDDVRDDERKRFIADVSGNDPPRGRDLPCHNRA
jgi:hypothetical protein